MRKVYVVQLDSKAVRSIITREDYKVGDIIEDEIFLGQLIRGGKIIKIFK